MRLYYPDSLGVQMSFPPNQIIFGRREVLSVDNFWVRLGLSHSDILQITYDHHESIELIVLGFGCSPFRRTELLV
jgi:hypothetical protein